MADPNFDQEMSNNMLTQVREGMEVYDDEDRKVGTVETVYFGEVGPESSRRGLGPQDISRASDPDEVTEPIDFAFGGTVSPSEDFSNMDEVIRNRLTLAK